MSCTLLQNNIVPEDIEMEETHDDMNKIEPAPTDYIPDNNRFDANEGIISDIA